MNFRGLLFSLFLHGGIAGGILLWNWSSFGQKTIEIQEAPPCTIPLEVTAISEVSQAPVSKPKSKKPVSEKKEPSDKGKTIAEDILPEPNPKPEEQPLKEEPKVEKHTLNEESKPEKKDIQKPKEEIPLLPPADQPKPKAKQKTPPPSITDSITKALDKLPPPQVKKKKPKKGYSEDFISVLKDVDKTEPEGPSAETPITDPNSNSPYGAARVGPSMAMSVIDRVRGALERVWRVPLRGENLVIVVEITTHPDGKISAVKVLHNQSTTRDPVYQVGVESVLKATDYFRNTPLPIPKEYRDEFKNFNFSFSVKKNYWEIIMVFIHLN